MNNRTSLFYQQDDLIKVICMEDLDGLILSDNFFSLPLVLGDFYEKVIALSKTNAVSPLACLLAKYFNELYASVRNHIKKTKSGEWTPTNEIKLLNEKFGICYQALADRVDASKSDFQYSNMSMLYILTNKLISIIEKNNAELKVKPSTSAGSLYSIQKIGELKDEITDFVKTERFLKAIADTVMLNGSRMWLPTNHRDPLALPLTLNANRLRNEIIALHGKIEKIENGDSISLAELEMAIGRYEASYEVYETDAKLNLPDRDWSVLKAVTDLSKKLIQLVQKYAVESDMENCKPYILK